MTAEEIEVGKKYMSLSGQIKKVLLIEKVHGQKIVTFRVLARGYQKTKGLGVGVVSECNIHAFAKWADKEYHTGDSRPEPKSMTEFFL